MLKHRKIRDDDDLKFKRDVSVKGRDIRTPFFGRNNSSDRKYSYSYKESDIRDRYAVWLVRLSIFFCELKTRFNNFVFFIMVLDILIFLVNSMKNFVFDVRKHLLIHDDEGNIVIDELIDSKLSRFEEALENILSDGNLRLRYNRDIALKPPSGGSFFGFRKSIGNYKREIYLSCFYDNPTLRQWNRANKIKDVKQRIVDRLHFIHYNRVKEAVLIYFSPDYGQHCYRRDVLSQVSAFSNLKCESYANYVRRRFREDVLDSVKSYVIVPKFYKIDCSYKIYNKVKLSSKKRDRSNTFHGSKLPSDDSTSSSFTVKHLFSSDEEYFAYKSLYGLAIDMETDENKESNCISTVRSKKKSFKFRSFLRKEKGAPIKNTNLNEREIYFGYLSAFFNILSAAEENITLWYNKVYKQYCSDELPNDKKKYFFKLILPYLYGMLLILCWNVTYIVFFVIVTTVVPVLIVQAISNVPQIFLIYIAYNLVFVSTFVATFRFRTIRYFETYTQNFSTAALVYLIISFVMDLMISNFITIYGSVFFFYLQYKIISFLFLRCPIQIQFRMSVLDRFKRTRK